MRINRHSHIGPWLDDALSAPPDGWAKVRLRWGKARDDASRLWTSLDAEDREDMLQSAEGVPRPCAIRLDWLDGTGAPLSGSRQITLAAAPAPAPPPPPTDYAPMHEPAPPPRTIIDIPSAAPLDTIADPGVAELERLAEKPILLVLGLHKQAERSLETLRAENRELREELRLLRGQTIDYVLRTGAESGRQADRTISALSATVKELSDDVLAGSRQHRELVTSRDQQVTDLVTGVLEAHQGQAEARADATIATVRAEARVGAPELTPEEREAAADHRQMMDLLDRVGGFLSARAGDNPAAAAASIHPGAKALLSALASGDPAPLVTWGEGAPDDEIERVQSLLMSALPQISMKRAARAAPAAS